MKIRSIIYGMLTVAAVAIVQSCSTSYPEITYVYDGPLANEETEGTLNIKPTLSFSNLVFVPTTRGTGAFDAQYGYTLYEKKFLASDFYVLALKHTEDGQKSNVSFESLMNTSSNKECLISTQLTPGSTTNRGKISRPESMNGVLQFYDDTTGQHAQEFYWEGSNEKTGYNFYAYHLDDAKINSFTTDNDHINCNITIDGTQDVMAGESRQMTEEYLEKNCTGLTDEVAYYIIYKGGGYYSTYSAEHGIQPVISMKHLLSRLKFYVVLQDNKSDLGGNKPKITIKSLRVIANTNLDCCLAARDSNEVKVTSSSDRDTLRLRNIPTLDEDGNLVNGAVTEMQDSMVYQQLDSLGESILVAPEESYEMELEYEQHLMTKYNDPDNPGHPKYEDLKRTAKATLQKKDGSMFEPGVEYIVTLNVFGAQRIDTDTDDTQWQEGCDVDIVIGE